MKLSAVVNTKNCADTLEQCLHSLSFVDEIVVVDMHSSDDTLNIAHQYTEQIFQHEDVGYVEPARNFAISQAQGDWILIADADEVVPKALATRIKEIIATGQDDCYFLPRKNIIFKHWINKAGWWPDYQLRLFRKGCVKWQDQIHSQPLIKGSAMKLPTQEKYALVHHHYQTVSQYIQRLNRYTDAEVISKEVENSATVQSFTLAFHQEFLRRFFSEEAIELGSHGLALSYLQSFYQLATQLKLWEEKRFPTQVSCNSQQQAIQHLQAALADYRFWLADWHVKHDCGVRKIYWQIRRKLRI